MSPAPEAKGFTEEEAGHIGWNFVSKYYESYNTNIDVLYSMYAPQSLLSHARFPHGDSTTPQVVKAKGRLAIKARYAEDDCADQANRIVITLAAIDACLGANILVVVYGEWAKADSQFYQFTQTFVLTSRGTTYFIANDVLRFLTWDLKDASSAPEAQLAGKQTDDVKVGDAETAAVTEPVTKDATPQPTAETTPAATTPAPEPQQPQQQQPQQQQSPAAGAATTAETVTSPEQPTPLTTTDESEAVVAEKAASQEPVEQQLLTTTEQQAEKQEKEEDKDEAKPVEEAKPEAKLSVTSLAAASPSPSLAPTPSSWAGIVSSLTPKPAAKPVAATTKKPVAPQSKPSSVSPQSPNGGFQPHHGDKQWNLVFLKVQGALRFDPEAIKASVEQEYGAIKFWKHSNVGWVCDFVAPELKTRALADKQMDVNGVTVLIEQKFFKKPINKDGKFVDKRKNFTKNGPAKFNKEGGYDKRKVH